VSSDDYDKASIDDVRNLTFVNNQGQRFQLSQFAAVTEVLGESVLQRQDRLPSITINANVQGRSVGTVGQEIMDRFGKEDFAAYGVSWVPSGQLEMQGDAFGSLLLA